MAAALERGWRLRTLWVWGATKDHHRRLKLAGGAGTRAHNLHGVEHRLRNATRKCLEAIVAKGGGELISEYIVPVVESSVFDLYAIPDQARKSLTAHLRIVRLIASERHAGSAATLFAIAAIGEILAAALRRPAPDGASSLVGLQEAIKAGSLTEDEAVAQAISFLGGMVTLISEAGTMLARLSERADIWRRLQTDRILIDEAIDEALRLGRVLPLRRATMEDIDLGATIIPARSRVVVYLNQANQDPAAFENPGSFEIGRQGQKHIGFGAGAHSCAGIQLVYAELRALLEGALDIIPVWPRETSVTFSLDAPGDTLIQTLVVSLPPAAEAVQ